MTATPVEKFNQFVKEELAWMYKIGIRAEMLSDEEVIVRLEIIREL